MPLPRPQSNAIDPKRTASIRSTRFLHENANEKLLTTSITTSDRRRTDGGDGLVQKSSVRRNYDSRLPLVSFVRLLTNKKIVKLKGGTSCLIMRSAS